MLYTYYGSTCYGYTCYGDTYYGYAWNNLAKVLGEAGRHDEAIGAARRAVEL